MSIYDRDWYKDHSKKRDAPEAGPQQSPAPVKPQPSAPPRKDPGQKIFGDWHWSLIALFWVFIAFLLALGLKYFR